MKHRNRAYTSQSGRLCKQIHISPLVYIIFHIEQDGAKQGKQTPQRQRERNTFSCAVLQILIVPMKGRFRNVIGLVIDFYRFRKAAVFVK